MNMPRGLLRAGRTAVGEPLALVRPLVGAVRAQFSMSRRNVYDLVPIVMQPAYTLVLMAVFVYAGREDLSAYAMVATMLMGVAATAIFIASDLMTREQDFQTFELTIASPAPFPAIILSRMLVITSISLIGIAESWLIIRFVFGVSLAIHHPWVFAATMLLTAFAAAGTALIPAALFSFARSARTYQNSITYPVYIFSGILVPLTVFPDWLATVWDVTQFGYYSRTHYQVNHPKTYIDSGYSFNLGASFPTALGAKVAKPDRPVVCATGDGGFMFNAVELSTAVQYGINVTTIVFRDDAYGNVARDLDEFFAGTYGTELLNPDIVKFAESFGAVGMRAKDPMDLGTLLPDALDRQAPVVIDVPIGDMPMPRAKLIAHVASLPWTVPQEGLIAS